MPKHLLLSIPSKNNINITKDFFQEYKQYFLQILELDYGKKWQILNSLIINQYTEKTEIQKFIQKISYKNIRSILNF